MVLTILLGFVVICGSVYDSYSLQWPQPVDNAEVVTSCTGGKASFLWEADLGPEEEVVLITWSFQGRFSSEVIAKYSNGNFLASGDYENRVEQVGLTGIVVSSLTEQDSGNYSVLLSVHNASSFFHTEQPEQDIALQVGDKLMAEDNRVRVSQLDKAQLDSEGRWSVALSCGHFTFLTKPPLSVEWTTPVGASVTSTRYDNGEFILLLANPVKGGYYSCVIPETFLSDACATDKDVKEGRTSDTVMIDELKVRMSLLEAEVSDLRTAHDNASTELAILEDKYSTTAHFTAHLSRANPAKGEAVLFDVIQADSAGAYNATERAYVIPYTGVYWVNVIADAESIVERLRLNLYADEELLGSADAADASDAVYSGAFELRVGQRLTVKRASDDPYDSQNLLQERTAFSVVLVKAL